jgi:hypothetical protein
MANNVALVAGVAPDAFLFTSNVAADDTVVIGDITYTFKATPAAAYDVDVGTDLDTSITNLVLAINRTGTPGATTYHTDTVANPYVTAAADLAADGIDLTARFPGSWINGLYLAATHPGANTIAALAAAFGDGAGVTAGSGFIPSFFSGLMDLNQVNAELQVELKKFTEAAD